MWVEGVGEILVLTVKIDIDYSVSSFPLYLFL